MPRSPAPLPVCWSASLASLPCSHDLDSLLRCWALGPSLQSPVLCPASPQMIAFVPCRLIKSKLSLTF